MHTPTQNTVRGFTPSQNGSNSTSPVALGISIISSGQQTDGSLVNRSGKSLNICRVVAAVQAHEVPWLAFGSPAP